ncbi:MAG: hypothetical protein AB7I42_25925 [Bradyrhizobium sp.]|uniref:hypothetical protein n=1 Tax=Bradyrhizobium sp. TaxID=376 RepID=UPI003D0D04E8
MTLFDYVETYFPVLASWSIGCAGAHSILQTVKMARRECGARRVPDIVLRALAGVLSGGITSIVAYRLFGMDIEKAMTHGWLVAILYPVLMAIIMAQTAKYFPEIHRRLSIATRRPGDKPATPDAPPAPPKDDPNDQTVERYF